MKKVININFSGRLINIDEDAYQALQDYIQSLKNYFSKEEGSEEIVSDIENRIAEIFAEKQKNGIGIALSDVHEVMTKIGKPEDFEEETIDNTQNANYSNNQQKNNNDQQFVNRSKLYRDGKDKMIGGVASGLANYFNIDTVLVRLIFIVLLFSSIGFFLYIILWIFVPESYQSKPSVDRRLYRNPDDKMIGGVASGLANYFGIDVWIPRLLFAAPFILSIIGSISTIAYSFWFNGGDFFKISIGGTTTIVYFILLWLVPEARTREEKMAMKGQRLDLESLKNNVQDGIKNFNEKANQFGETIREKASAFSTEANQFGKQVHNQFNNASVGKKVSSGLGLIIKGFALFIGGIIAFTLLLAAISFIIGLGAFWPIKEYIINSSWQQVWLWGTILFLIVPIVLFITWLLRRMLKLNTDIKPFKIIMSMLGTLGFFCAVALTFSILKSVRSDNDSVIVSETQMQQPTSTLNVKATQPEIQYTGTLPWIELGDSNNGFDITKDSLKYNNIRLIIEKSPDSLYHTYLKKYSRGSSIGDAENKAKQIQYMFSSFDNTIDLGSHISIAKNEGFRIQQMQVIIQVPIGKKIMFDKTIDKLHNYGVRIRESYSTNKFRKRHRKYETYSNVFDYDIDTEYIMNDEGKLKTSIELKEEKLEIEKQRLEDLKNEQNNKTITDEQDKIRLEQEKKESKQREIEENNRKIEELKRQNEEIKAKEVTKITDLESNLVMSTTNIIGVIQMLN
jgi:phage shock protein PspC (stress-responsive transcriptional regulator)